MTIHEEEDSPTPQNWLQLVRPLHAHHMTSVACSIVICAAQQQARLGEGPRRKARLGGGRPRRKAWLGGEGPRRGEAARDDEVQPRLVEGLHAH